MKRVWLFTLGLCLWLGFGLPTDALGSGDFLGLWEEPPCIDKSQVKNPTFTRAQSTYVFAGSVDLVVTRLNLPTKAPWTGVGTYDPPTGQTKEDIIVPAPRIDQPSRPYGRFLVTMHCKADPWLTSDVRCDLISTTVDAPLDRTAPNVKGWKQPYPLAPRIIGDIKTYRRPYTGHLCDDAKNALNAQYRAYLAQRSPQRLRGGPITQPPGSAVTKFQGGSLILKQPLTPTPPPSPPPPPPQYGATYAPASIPSLRTGKTATVQVKVTNTGSLTWGANSAFKLSYHWYRGRDAVRIGNEQTALPQAVTPNQAVTVQAKVKAPSNAGTYTLRWDMVEGVTWFSQKGVPPGDQTVVVK